jgi:hypothetical protein
MARSEQFPSYSMLRTGVGTASAAVSSADSLIDGAFGRSDIGASCGSDLQDGTPHRPWPGHVMEGRAGMYNHPDGERIG